jgi:hypothetical protein
MLAKTCPERGRTTSIQNPYYISPLPSERQREGRFRLALAIAGLAGMTSELLNGFRKHHTGSRGSCFYFQQLNEFALQAGIVIAASSISASQPWRLNHDGGIDIRNGRPAALGHGDLDLFAENIQHANDSLLSS